MNITIIGASAGVGLEIVTRALKLGHKVTALARRRVDIDQNSDLTVIQGDALNKECLRKAIAGTEAILVTLGTGMDTRATTLYTNFANTLLDIHSKEPITVPIIVLTGFGCRESRPYLVWFVRPVFHLLLNKVYKDKANMERLIEGSTLRWEFVRPGILNNKLLTENYRVEPILRPKMNIRNISRADVADYMVKEAAEQKNLGKSPALTSK